MGWNGHEVAEFLRRKEHLEVEMEAAGYVIALTSIADTDEGFKRLKNALIHIEENIFHKFCGRRRKTTTEESRLVYQESVKNVR